MQNLDKSTACIECWNDLRDEKSTKSHDKLFQTLTKRSVKNFRKISSNFDLLVIYLSDIAVVQKSCERILAFPEKYFVAPN